MLPDADAVFAVSAPQTVGIANTSMRISVKIIAERELAGGRTPQ